LIPLIRNCLEGKAFSLCLQGLLRQLILIINILAGAKEVLKLDYPAVVKDSFAGHSAEDLMLV
jgi:hypothetical protein